jgi:hypothetical protein
LPATVLVKESHLIDMMGEFMGIVRGMERGMEREM